MLIYIDIPEEKTYFHVFMFPCLFKVHGNCQTFKIDRHLEISTWQDYRTCMEARASNIKAWKHESILLYFYSTNKTQCHFDSTSVA